MSRAKRTSVASKAQRLLAKEFGKRLFARWHLYQAGQPDVTRLGHRVLGEMVGRELEIEAPKLSTIGRWFVRSMPDYATVAALARILGCRAGWLAFGEGPAEADLPAALPLTGNQLEAVAVEPTGLAKLRKKRRGA